jgi:hypothetical protein
MMKGDLCWICQCDVVLKKVSEVKDVITQEMFSIVECPRCTVIRTLPVPADLSKYYDSDIGNMWRATPNRVRAFLKRILLERELRRVFAKIQPGTFVDIGCGVGDFAYAIHQKSHPVITADAAAERPVAIRQINSIPYYHIDFDRCEIDGLGTLGRSTVILRHVLEHIRNPRAFLKRLIAYGASFFYIVVPNSASVERHVLGRYWSMWDPPRHLWHFNPRSLRVLCEGINMTVLNHGYDTIPNIIPSLYRFLRLRGASSGVYDICNPNGVLNSLSTPLNLLLPFNVTWVIASVSR